MELATGHKALFDDMDKVNELMAQAAEYCMTGEEHIDLAKGHWKLLGDRDKATESYRQALAEITDKDTLLELANRSANELQDTELAKAVYAKVEERMSSASEFDKLARSVVADLRDKDYTAEIYERAARLVAPNDLMNLAGEVVQQLADKSRTTSVYRKAFENSTDLKQLLKLLDNVTTNIQNQVFATEILEKAESLSEASSDRLDVAKKVMEAVGDKDLAARILEAAEESVTSLGELRSVTDMVKQYFGDNADWLARIEEKLTKREANQAKYNASQERENQQAHTVLDYLRLADAVMEELDDRFYARKLLTTAEQRYAGGGYDFNLGRDLIRAVDHHLGDQEWVQRLLEEAAGRCQTFVCIHDAGQTAVNDLSDKKLAASLARSYYQDWQQKLDNAHIRRTYDYIKLAKVVGKELADTAWAGGLIDKAAEIGGGHLAFGEMGISAFAVGETEKAKELVEKALEQCQSPAALIQLAVLLRSNGIPTETVNGVYANAKDRWGDSRERLDWVEGIVEVLRDREWAAIEYDALVANFASGPEAVRFQASRQSRLNLGLW